MSWNHYEDERSFTDRDIGMFIHSLFWEYGRRFPIQRREGKDFSSVKRRFEAFLIKKLFGTETADE